MSGSKKHPTPLYGAILDLERFPCLNYKGNVGIQKTPPPLVPGDLSTREVFFRGYQLMGLRPQWLYCKQGWFTVISASAKNGSGSLQ